MLFDDLVGVGKECGRDQNLLFLPEPKVAGPPSRCGGRRRLALLDNERRKEFQRYSCVVDADVDFARFDIEGRKRHGNIITTNLSGPDATARVSCSAGVAGSMRLGYGVSALRNGTIRLSLPGPARRPWAGPSFGSLPAERPKAAFP